jgi:anthranilate synthase component 1
MSHKINLRRFPFKQSPSEIFSKLHDHFEYAYILESAEGPRKLARYSFIGFNPALTVKIKNTRVEVQNRKNNETVRTKVNDPLALLREILRSRSIPYKGLRFIGGAVGYISYDSIRYWERLPSIATDNLDFPDIEVGVFDDGIIFDHARRQAFYYYLEEDRSFEVKKLIKEVSNPEQLSFSQPRANFVKEKFEDAVMKVKEFISSGDVFQVVLSKRYEFQIKGDLILFYKRLRKINPSPYMFFLKMGDRHIVGSSPEMLMRVENGLIETFPIAGTRPRVKSRYKNEKLARDLMTDPKEQAEHVMLIDLARNDVGKISEFGSVNVREFMTVHRFSHVQHIVSRVVGKLKAECDCYDALRAVFPAGTVSGAPKIRAMEIIEEFEPVRRGPYAGAVGYFSYNGNADFAIAIRSLFANENSAYIQVGAGIVADSTPESEWFETEYKASALIQALMTSRGDKS